MANLPPKLISQARDHMLLWQQVWSWSIQKYSKNKVFIMVWSNFDLDPAHLVWWLLNPWY
jgi:hypothetical protein